MASPGEHAEQDHAKGRHDREAELQDMAVSQAQRARNIDETDAGKDEHCAKRAVRHVGQRRGEEQEHCSCGQCAHDAHDLGAAFYRVIDCGARVCATDAESPREARGDVCETEGDKVAIGVYRVAVFRGEAAAGGHGAAKGKDGYAGRAWNEGCPVFPRECGRQGKVQTTAGHRAKERDPEGTKVEGVKAHRRHIEVETYDPDAPLELRRILRTYGISA